MRQIVMNNKLEIPQIGVGTWTSRSLTRICRPSADWTRTCVRTCWTTPRLSRGRLETVTITLTLTVTLTLTMTITKTKT